MASCAMFVILSKSWEVPSSSNIMMANMRCRRTEFWVGCMVSCWELCGWARVIVTNTVSKYLPCYRGLKSFWVRMCIGELVHNKVGITLGSHVKHPRWMNWQGLLHTSWPGSNKKGDKCVEAGHIAASDCFHDLRMVVISNLVGRCQACPDARRALMHCGGHALNCSRVICIQLWSWLFTSCLLLTVVGLSCNGWSYQLHQIAIDSFQKHPIIITFMFCSVPRSSVELFT